MVSASRTGAGNTSKRLGATRSSAMSETNSKQPGSAARARWSRPASAACYSMWRPMSSPWARVRHKQHDLDRPGTLQVMPTAGSSGFFLVCFWAVIGADAVSVRRARDRGAARTPAEAPADPVCTAAHSCRTAPALAGPVASLRLKALGDSARSRTPTPATAAGINRVPARSRWPLRR